MGDSDQLRLKALGIVVPSVFLIVLEFGRLALESSPLWTPDLMATWRGLFIVGLFVCVVAFGLLMFSLIDRHQRVVVQENLELAATHELLLRVSRLDPTTETLTAIAERCGDLLDARATVCIRPELGSVLRLEPEAVLPTPDADGRFSFGSPLATLEAEPAAFSVPIAGPVGQAGALKIGRRQPPTPREESLLEAFARLASIALTSASLREDARHTAVLEERTRIARETHDTHAQVLAAVQLRLRLLLRTPAVADDPGLAAQLTSLADDCASAYADAREVITQLRDSDKPRGSLDDALAAYVRRYRSSVDFEVVWRNELGAGVSLTPRTESELLRVVQEALTNVRKHAGAATVSVELRGTPTSTLVTITDDGRGFAPAAGASEGYGMVTMRERMASVGGTVTIASTPGAGTCVSAEVPEAARVHPGAAA